MKFISSSFIRSSSFFSRVSASVSGGLVSSSYTVVSSKDLGGFTGNFTTNKVEYLIPSQSAGGSDDVKALIISASGDNPRIGIGLSNPIKAFDFKEVRDDDRGGEILIRGSRSTKGAEVNDEVGRINFAIDSASFGKIDTSGSAAEIVALVDEVDETGIKGHMSFRVASAKTGAPIELLKLSSSKTVLNTPLDLNGALSVDSSDINASTINRYNNTSTRIELEANHLEFRGNAYNLKLGNTGADFNPSSIAALDFRVRSDNDDAAILVDSGDDTITLGSGANTHVTASGNISASGDITANNGTFSGNITATGDIIAQRYIVSSSVSHITSSFSSGSTIFGDTLDDTHQFTGSLSISGSITTDGDLSIQDFTSVSASLATIPTNNNQLTNGAGYTTNTGTVDTTGTPANNQLAIFTDSNTVEGDSNITWNGSTFTINGTGSVDLLQVDDRLQGNGSGFQFFAFNEDTIKVKFANWYSSNDRQYGMGQLWYETWFAAIDNQAGRDNRRIGFYLEEPDAGSTDSGTPGQHPSNARFYVDITGSYIASGGLHVTDANFNVESNGNVEVNGNISVTGTVDGVDVATLKSDFDTLEGKTLFSGSSQVNADSITNFDTNVKNKLDTDNVISASGVFTNNEFIVAVGNGAVTSSDALAVDSNGNLGIGTPNPEVRLHMLGEAPQTTQILMEQFNNTADAPDIRVRRYRGTSASRADVQTNDYLFRLNVHGQDDGSSELYGSMQFDVDSSDQDALNWRIQTRDTSGTNATRMSIDSAGDVNIVGQLSISGFSDVSASLAAAVAGGDNLGNHTATQDLNMGGNNITSVTNITASGNISSSDTTHTKFLRLPQTAGTNTEGAIYFGSSLSGNNGYIYDDGNNLQLGYNDSDILQVNDSTPQVSITGDLKVFGGGAGTITATGKISGSSMESSGDIHLATNNTQITQILANGATRDLIGFDGDNNAVVGNLTANKVSLVGNVTASGDISASGTITGNSIVGTLATAAQTNITSVGTLSSLTMGGDIDTDGNNINVNSGEVNSATSIDSNVFKMGNGSVSTPALAFTNDTNTGLYSVAIDTLGIAAGGQNKLNVGSTTTTFSNNAVNMQLADADGAVLSVTNTYTSTNPDGAIAIKGVGCEANGTPGSSGPQSYGGYFLAGDTNEANPDTVALYAQGHEDGAPNSYAAIFSGSAGGVVGINTTEPTVELEVSGDGKFSGALEIGGISDVSASIAAAGGGGSSDNLGNHTATQDLDLSSNNIKGITHITASGNISASGIIVPQFDTKVHSFFTSDANGDLIPMGGSLSESTTPQYYLSYLSPYGGQLIRAYVMTTSSGTGDFTLSLRKYTAFSTFTTIATATGTINSSYTPTLAEFSAHTFDPGDWLAIHFAPTGTPSGVNVTSLWRMDSI